MVFEDFVPVLGLAALTAPFYAHVVYDVWRNPEFYGGHLAETFGSKKEIKDEKLRTRIKEYVMEHQGQTFRQIRKAVGSSRLGTGYHLHQLNLYGNVKNIRRRFYCRTFPQLR